MQNVPIFYRPEMSAHTESFSPSPSKPKRTVDEWLKYKAIKPEQIHTFPAASVEDLYTAHAAYYVDGVLSGKVQNGFGNFDQAIADTLRFTTGSMLAAALHVAEHGGFACSPTSGFHHAHYTRGGGFCTFNGLMVAAIELDKQGVKVGILDCDAHYGDGTQNIIDTLGLQRIRHLTLGKLHPPGQKRPDALQWIEHAIDNLAPCDVVLYQAGADPYEHDPLGGQMSMTELAVRDEYAFSRLKNVAWNLAGGYCNMTQAIHFNTLSAAQGKF